MFVYVCVSALCVCVCVCLHCVCMYVCTVLLCVSFSFRLSFSSRLHFPHFLFPPPPSLLPFFFPFPPLTLSTLAMLVFGCVAAALVGLLMLYPLSSLFAVAVLIVKLLAMLSIFPFVFAMRLLANIWWPQRDISKVREIG